MKLKLLTVLLTLSLVSSIYSGDIDNSYYHTTVLIVSAGNLEHADLKPCPVYDNKQYAFTMRWDDNNQANFRMQNLMHKYGFKGTFYLNARKGYDFKRICDKGTDAGAHSMTHPSLPTFICNLIFQEAVEIKPYLESRTDRAINTYCFSYGSYRNYTVPETGHWIAEILQRAGYHFNTYTGFVDQYCKQKDPVSSFRQIYPGDTNPSIDKFENALHSKLTNPKYNNKDPNIGIGVHVWMKTDKAWDNMAAILKKYSGRKDWWYCTQTDYAAYRKLYKLCRISAKKIKDNAVEYKIVLPYASDIGSDIPLTMCFDGKASTIQVNGKHVEVKYVGGKSYFNISPPSYAKTPTVISYARNRSNIVEPVKPAKTRIKPWLSIDKDDKLKLVLQTEQPESITNIRIKYILPLMYNHIIAGNIKTLPVGKKVITKQLQKVGNDKIHGGTPFLLCQVDYLANGKPERAYASTFGNKSFASISNCFRDKSLISSTFSNPTDLKEEFCLLSKSGQDNTGLKWFKSTAESRAVYNEDTTSIYGRMKGKDRKFSKKTPYIAVRYSLDAKEETDLHITNGWLLRCMPNLFVNGTEIPKDKMSYIKLTKGNNNIIMVIKLKWLYPSLTFHYAAKE